MPPKIHEAIDRITMKFQVYDEHIMRKLNKA